MSGAETVIAVVVIMAYSVGRQTAGEPLRIKRLIGLPAALMVMASSTWPTAKGLGPPASTSSLSSPAARSTP